MTAGQFRQFLVGRARRIVGCVFASVLLLAACAASGTGSPDPGVAPGSTLSGNYLAARHARTAHRPGAAAEFLKAALAISPDDPLLLQRAVSALILDGRTAEAVPLARRALAVDGDASLPRLTVAAAEARAGSFDTALAQLQPLASDTGLGPLLPLLKAWALAGQQRVDDALALLEAQAVAANGSGLYRMHAAWIADYADRGAAAAAQLQAVLDQRDQPWLRLTELAGAAFVRAGDKERAAALYAAYLGRHPGAKVITAAAARLDSGQPPEREIRSGADGLAEAFFDGAGLARRQNTVESALIFGQLGLYLRPDFAALRMVVGDLMEDAERYEDANGIYAGIAPTSPFHQAARLSIARNLDRLDRFDDAGKELERLASEHPKDPDPLSELGDMLRKRDRFREAVTAYDQAVARIEALGPQHWRILYARGIALERSKDWSRAETDFLKALEFEPEQPFVLNYLGYSWVEQGRNLGEAERMIRKAVELRPNDGYIVDSLGWVLFRLGRQEEAVPHLEKAVELKPEDPVINDHLGDAYWVVGRQREARFQWLAALGLKPEAELKTQIEQKLQNGLIREANAGTP